MDKSTALEASPSSSPSSSSSSTSSSPYDVFLSFSGEDTRKTFTDHLYWTMKDAGIDSFMEESESVRIGENMTEKVKQIIEGSRVSVIVFSSRYADTIWCLEELVQIMECRRKVKQIVLPIFYDLSPSDSICTFVQAFQKHRERFHEEKIERWTDALIEAAGLTVRVFRTINGYEGLFIREVIDEITRQLKNPTPVGIASPEIQRIDSPELQRLDSSDSGKYHCSKRRSVESPETNNFSDNSNFEFPEYLEISKALDEDLTSAAPEFSVRNSGFQGNEVDESGTRSSQPGGSSCRGESGISPKRREATESVAFKTKSEASILDDGFIWRKYGKKRVKNSPYPRAYYKCAVEGCLVKKRVERDREDSRYLITTYEGVHNHPNSRVITTYEGVHNHPDSRVITTLTNSPTQ